MAVNATIANEMSAYTWCGHHAKNGYQTSDENKDCQSKETPYTSLVKEIEV